MEFRKMVMMTHIQDSKRITDIKTYFWTPWEKARVG